VLYTISTTKHVLIKNNDGNVEIMSSTTPAIIQTSRWLSHRSL